ncbi:MAG: TIGR00730 family Rossman fold protein [Muribaculaceae bacterium]|nr:TIGR00730 family Rossman fold protein [Muribaculaceae bacterium]
MNATNHQQIRNAITVYGASSENIPRSFKDAAFEVGRLIALSEHPLVCGGGRAGLMRCAIEGAHSAGGVTIGVLPAFMVAKEWQHPALTQMIETPDMHTRKATMASLSQAAIACPGGVGTFEELLEIITWRQLGLYKGNVVILNVDGYYDPLIAMLREAVAAGCMRPECMNICRIARHADEAVEMALAPADTTDYSRKIH